LTVEGSADREVLAGAGQRENYAGEENLLKRQSLRAFIDPSSASGGLPIERLQLSGNERLLDVGCGNGRWLLRATPRVAWSVGLDLSEGMLKATRARNAGPALSRGDAQALPFADASFDVVLAMHMLYHVEDRGLAIRELHRVLRSGGTALVTTNSAETTPIDALSREAIATVLHRPVQPVLPALSFTAENGEDLLASVFDDVSTAWHEALQRITDPGAVVTGLESVRGPMEMFLDVRLDWAEVTREVTTRVETAVSREGAFINPSRSISFLCRKD
jgi:SAM-dependent methyltransferase